MTLLPTHARSRLIATTRNYVGKPLGDGRYERVELHDTRVYLRWSAKLKETDFERRVRVETTCEMEVVTKGRRL